MTRKITDGLAYPALRMPNMELQVPQLPKIPSRYEMQADALEDGVFGLIKARQSALAQDEELQLFHVTLLGVIRVVNITLSATDFLVMDGNDGEGNATQIYGHISTFQLISKVVKVIPPTEPIRIGFVSM